LWEARRNPQTVLRSHFTWCDDRQEILPREEEELVWSRSHTHRLDCLAFCSRHKTPLGGHGRSPLRSRHHKHIPSAIMRIFADTLAGPSKKLFVVCRRSLPVGDRAKPTSFFSVYFLPNRRWGAIDSAKIIRINIAVRKHSFFLETRFRNLNSLLSPAQLPFQGLTYHLTTDLLAGDTISTTEIEY